ncbi:MAG: hypothetical protein ACOC4M_08160 [Promethearchaeia archaeon]
MIEFIIMGLIAVVMILGGIGIISIQFEALSVIILIFLLGLIIQYRVYKEECRE